MNKRLLSTLVLGSAFIATAVSSAPFITVTEQRLMDQRIQATVMDVLARSTDLSGRVRAFNDETASDWSARSSSRAGTRTIP